MKPTGVKIFLLFILLLLWPSELIFSQDLYFSQEKICIEVRESYCILTGNYWFINHGNKIVKQNLYYPFIVNESLPFPYKYEVKMIGTNENLPAVKVEKGIVFNIEILPGDTAWIEIIYHQYTPDSVMEYILTTTKQWGSQFISAEYIAILPEEYELVTMVPEYDKIIEKEGTKTYSVLRYNYLPEENFLIKWKGAGNEKDKN